MAAPDTSALVAAFLAKGGAITTAPAGVAYGVDPAADTAKRREARIARASEASEQAAERYMEGVLEAYHAGGRQAAIDAMGRS